MKKKVVAILLTTVLAGTMLTGCGGSAGADSDKAQSEEGEASGEPVELNVTTTFAGEDSNAGNYRDGIAAWEEASGNTVNDGSASADETFKTTIATDFEMDAEPDVLFFYTGADANDFVSGGKVMSIEQIREKYPDYASNMDDSRIPVSLVDGKSYAVPTNGYWEGLFCNTEVLEDCGIEVPGADYTWEQFMDDCSKIKEKGYTPVAAALGNIPHYWWEYSIFNNETDISKHAEVPADISGADAWVAGMNDVKAMYEAGCFPENTLSATDDETFQLFVQDKAAFLVDGSWKIGGIVGACQSDPNDPATLDQEKLDKFAVTYVPAKGARKATDLIGGFSMGYYITAKAWEDPDKQAAAVDFVNFMTSDDMIMKFAQHSANPLKETPDVDKTQFNSLQLNALEMAEGTTSFVDAAQDVFNGECRVSTFDGMPQIVTGEVDAKDAVEEGLKVYAEMNSTDAE